MRDVPAGSDGLILQPFWSPGTSNPEAKGAVIGFADYHTRVHVYRAIIEGIGFALYDALKSMEKRAGYDIKRIMVSGGGANSEEVCQITADLFGCKVQKFRRTKRPLSARRWRRLPGSGNINSFRTR